MEPYSFDARETETHICAYDQPWLVEASAADKLNSFSLNMNIQIILSVFWLQSLYSSGCSFLLCLLTTTGLSDGRVFSTSIIVLTLHLPTVL